MARIEKTVFISYRRKDISWALAVYQYLTSQKYDVFFDFSSLSSGDFEQVIISNIKARAHFVLILTPTALDRCSEPGDWLRREIEIAIDQKRNVIPLFFDGFNFGLPSIAQKLTGKLSAINRYNGLDIPSGYFMEAMGRLSNRYLNAPLDAVIHPVSTEVQKVVKDEKVAANNALIQRWEDIKELVKPAEEKSENEKKTTVSPLPFGRGGKGKMPNLRPYRIGAGILLIATLGLLGINSLIQNENGREAPMSDGVTLTNTVIPNPSEVSPTERITKESPTVVVDQTPTVLPAFAYKVVGGDSCPSIAIKFDISLQNIMNINGDLDCNTLFIGQTLEIPYPIPTPGVNTTQTQIGIGSTLVSPKDGMLMVYVPAGQFLMGSDDFMALSLLTQ